MNKKDYEYWYEHHNPKLSNPLIKELLNSLDGWKDLSWHNDCLASIGIEFKKHQFLIIQVPNSKNMDIDQEEFNRFYIILNGTEDDNRINYSNENIKEVIIKAKQLEKEFKTK